MVFRDYLREQVSLLKKMVESTESWSVEVGRERHLIHLFLSFLEAFVNGNLKVALNGARDIPLLLRLADLPVFRH